ncbi:uncharacterized protein LOC112203606 [Rosa chinensis]|uniref:uncharacterized protein LOC112203606 n=1 Tax=Rosa chinensis TaxID=74649 RepID=UPI000D0914CD|nr:uncharacterized protein LOC112203606 [Rosa chinensis]
MTDPISSLVAAFTLNDNAHVDLGLAKEAALQDSHHYLVGQLLTQKPNLVGFIRSMPTIWRMKGGLSIKVVGTWFVFQFVREEDRNHYLHGGPWFYRNTMLLLAPYDGITNVDSIPLHSLELWITVRGLPLTLQNKLSLSMIGSAIGRVLRLDTVALKRKDVEQRIRMVIDTKRRFRVFRSFSFSSSVEVDVTIQYEKVQGFVVIMGCLIT